LDIDYCDFFESLRREGIRDNFEIWWKYDGNTIEIQPVTLHGKIDSTDIFENGGK
jgi:hypothetical protein